MKGSTLGNEKGIVVASTTIPFSFLLYVVYKYNVSRDLLSATFSIPSEYIEYISQSAFFCGIGICVRGCF